MKPWKVLDRARAPDGAELTLIDHDGEFVIRANTQALMSSRMHHSEDALGTLGCAQARRLKRPRVLVGGLGMGFTLRAALDVLPAAAQVVVAELVPAVIAWNRGVLAPLANHPLADRRVRVDEGDVAITLRSARVRFDAILLDVDNGPTPLTASANAGLYNTRGVASAFASLRPGGVLAIWSAKDDVGFERRLRAAGFVVRREYVSGRVSGDRDAGPRHTILLAERPLAERAGTERNARG